MSQSSGKPTQFSPWRFSWCLKYIIVISLTFFDYLTLTFCDGQANQTLGQSFLLNSFFWLVTLKSMSKVCQGQILSFFQAYFWVLLMMK